MRQGYFPCSACGRYGSEWVEIDGIEWAVTAPYGVKVGEGDEWTCWICVRQGHEQKASPVKEGEETRNMFQGTEVQ